jgi:hypothetical protein
MSPIYEIEEVIAYADDNYIVRGNTGKKETIQATQESVDRVVDWLTKSGMKVNLGKTEVVIFHKIDTASEELVVVGNLVKSKKSMKILGVEFDSRLSWEAHIQGSISGANRALQGIRIIKRFFTKTECVQLLTSFYYSKLYYGSHAWLNDSVKKRHMQCLNSASGRALKIIDCNILSFDLLHRTYMRATPNQWRDYGTALLLYETMWSQIPATEWAGLHYNILTNNRSNELHFTSSNNYRCGLNLISNRFKTITGKIPFQWLNLTKDCYKKRCKDLFIC